MASAVLTLSSSSIRTHRALTRPDLEITLPHRRTWRRSQPFVWINTLTEVKANTRWSFGLFQTLHASVAAAPPHLDVSSLLLHILDLPEHHRISPIPSAQNSLFVCVCLPYQAVRSLRRTLCMNYTHNVTCSTKNLGQFLNRHLIKI